MGNVGLQLSVSIALLFGLSLGLASSDGTNTCISECFDTDQNGSYRFICQPANISLCQEEEEEKRENPFYEKEPTILSNLYVTHQQSSQYVLNFTWTIPLAKFRDEYYNVRISEYDKVILDRKVKSRCETVGISAQTNKAHSFSHSCYDKVLAGTNYSISLRSLPNDDISLVYYFTTPENLTNMHDPPTLKEWDSIVGIAMAVVNQTTYAYIVFQPAPRRFNITSYHIYIKATHGTFSYEDRIIMNTSLSSAYHHMVPFSWGDNEDQYFYAEIKPEKCDSNCPVIQSSPIKAPELTVQESSVPTSKQVPSTTKPVPPNITSTTTTPAETTTVEGPVVIVTPQKNSTDGKNVTIIVAVVCGVAVAGIVIGVVYCVVKKKQCCTSGSFAMQRFRDQESNSSIAMDGSYKNQSTILIIYSYDCEAHERVVVEFATYLKHVFGCEVSLDIWEQADIQARGVYIWMREKLQWSQYVIVICSTGARFKCVRKKPFRVKEEQPVPDIFQDAVDLVAESLRYARECGEPTSKFIVSYFDYSRDSDIPPKLDTLDFYFLMRDIYKLFCHISGISADDTQQRNFRGLTGDTYSNTETGRQLYEAIERAKCFFEDNPDWLGNALEPNPSFLPGSPTTPTHIPTENENQTGSELVSDSHESSPRHSVSPQPDVHFKMNGSSRVSSTSVSLASEEEALIDDRRKKRKKDFLGSLDRWKNKHSRTRNDSIDSLDSSQPPITIPAPSEAPRSLNSESPIYQNGMEPGETSINSEQIGSIPVTKVQSALKKRNPFSRQKDRQEDEESFVEDDLQRDIDLIQNYDLHLQALNPTTQNDILLTVPASVHENKMPLSNGSIGFSNKLYDIQNGIDVPVSSPNLIRESEYAVQNDCSDISNNNVQDYKLPATIKTVSKDTGQQAIANSQTTNV